MELGQSTKQNGFAATEKPSVPVITTLFGEEAQ